MLKRQVHRYIDQRIASALGPQGFERCDERGVFRRSWAGGFDSLVVMLTDHRPRFDFDMSFAVRHDGVEELATRFDDRKLPGNEGDSVTSMTTMGELRRPKGPYGPYYSASSERELAYAMDEFAAYVTGEGLAHFEELRRESELERRFNEYPANPCIHARNEVRRVIRGLVMASRIRPHALDDLIQAYRDIYIAGWSARDVKHARDLIRYLAPDADPFAGTPTSLDLQPGRRRVRHSKLGIGEVVRELDGGAKLEVRFSNEAQTRLLLAKFVVDEPSE